MIPLLLLLRIKLVYLCTLYALDPLWYSGTVYRPQTHLQCVPNLFRTKFAQFVYC